MTTIERIEFGGWPNCYRIANEEVELVVTTDIGPRVIRFGFIGQRNEFAEYPDAIGQVGGDEWRLYGGHRLWHAPEGTPRSYYPDNGPVALERHDDFVRVIQPTEPTTGIQKEIDIRLAPDGAHVQMTHRLRNHNLWAVELAPWALSVMATGGVAILPLPPRGSHPQDLAPVNTLTMWAYTDMSDPRWTWGYKYILLRQEPGNPKPQKVGMMVTDGWIAYARQGHLFVKQFAPVAGAAYPDWNCTAEVFTCDTMLEMETLGPLTRLEPDTTVEHVESWHLLDDVPQLKSEADVEQHVLPRIRAIAW